MSGTEDEVAGTAPATPPPNVRHQPNSADPPEPPHFFKLPLELRTMIYRDVLTHFSAGPQLLATCREIYNEAYAFLFERPLTFRGQAALYRWLEHTPEEHRKRVSEITLELHDADLQPLITSGAEGDAEPGAEADADAEHAEPNDPPRLQAWDLYDAELESLHSSLSKLGSLSQLTVRALSESRSFLYREFLANFLNSLSSIWPDLRGLTLEGNFHHQNLSFIAKLPGLRSISFDGFSSTPPAEMATLLGGLTKLKRLALVSQYSLLTPTTHLHSALSAKRQSFTKDVLAAVKHIASFAVTERVQSSAPALFFTPEMLETLHNHSALKTLTIRLAQKPDEETLGALDAFLGQSGIERLEFDWPGFKAGVLERHELLPGSLKWVWVRVASERVARDLLRTVMNRRDAGGLKGIRSVVLMRDGRFGVEETGPVFKEVELKKRNDSAVAHHHTVLPGQEITENSGAIEARGTGEVHDEPKREARAEVSEPAPENQEVQTETVKAEETDTTTKENHETKPATPPAEIRPLDASLPRQEDTVLEQDTVTAGDNGGVAGDEEVHIYCSLSHL